jgi:hypothetical protein
VSAANGHERSEADRRSQNARQDAPRSIPIAPGTLTAGAPVVVLLSGGRDSVCLLDLAVSGEIAEPTSHLGEHINENWEDLVGPSNRSLVHWIRRLVFRGAWLDQRVKEGELDVVFDERTQTFGYVQPDRSAELIELSKEPSWRRIAYRR